MELKDVAEVRKVKFIESAPRLAPADARSTLDRFKSALKQLESDQTDQFARASETLHRGWVCKSTSVSTCKPVCMCWTGLHVQGRASMRGLGAARAPNQACEPGTPVRSRTAR